VGDKAQIPSCHYYYVIKNKDYTQTKQKIIIKNTMETQTKQITYPLRRLGVTQVDEIYHQYRVQPSKAVLSTEDKKKGYLKKMTSSAH
jgi:hypothetical protein